MFANTGKIPRETWRPLWMKEDWVVLCQDLYQAIGEEESTEIHELLKEVCENIGVKETVQNVAGLGKVAWRQTQEEPIFSAKDEQVHAFDRRPALRESPLSRCQVDTSIPIRPCGCVKGRRRKVEASETSYVSFDRLDDPWPSLNV